MTRVRIENNTLTVDPPCLDPVYVITRYSFDEWTKFATDARKRYWSENLAWWVDEVVSQKTRCLEEAKRIRAGQTLLGMNIGEEMYNIIRIDPLTAMPIEVVVAKRPRTYIQVTQVNNERPQ